MGLFLAVQRLKSVPSFHTLSPGISRWIWISFEVTIDENPNNLECGIHHDSTRNQDTGPVERCTVMLHQWTTIVTLPIRCTFSLSHGLDHYRQGQIDTMKVLFNKQIFHSPKNNNNNTISNSQNNKSQEDSISFDFDSSLLEFHESVGSMNGHLYERRRSMNDRWSLSSRWFDSSSKSIKAPSLSDDPMSHMWTKSAMNQQQESSSSSSQSFFRRNNK